MMIKKLISSILVTLFFGVVLANAQSTSILPLAKTQFFDQNGNPLSSGKVYFYSPGTTTAKTTWQDYGQITPNTNPIVLDAGGRALIWGSGYYRQQVYDRSNNLIWDQITASAGASQSAGSIGDGLSVGTILSWSGLVAPTNYQFAYGQSLSRITYAALMNAITLSTSVTCTGASPTITNIADTSNIAVGAVLEANCVSGSPTVVSKTANSVTLSGNATLSFTTSGVFFLYGNGDGINTFNVPDYRGYVLAGRCNMGGVSCSVIDSTYFSSNANNTPSALNAKGGSKSSTLLTANLPPYTPAGTIGGSQTIAPLFNGAVGLISGGTGSAFFTQNATINGSNFTFTGTAQGGASTPLSQLQPTITANYIIKVNPDINTSASSISQLVPGTPNQLVGTDNSGIYNTVTVPTGLSLSGLALNFDIPSLTQKLIPNAANDYVILYDAAGNATKKATVASVASAGVAGVSSLGGAVGAISLGSGLSMGGTTLSNSGVLSVGGSIGAITTTNGVKTVAGAVQTDYAANNTWTGDNYFASGRPWCDVRAKGAVGDGVTDDTAAFAACLTQILTTKGYSSGTIYVPPSTNPYCLKTTNGVYGNVALGVNTGSTSTGGIIFQGSGVQGTSLSTCGVNQTVFRINNQWVSIRDMEVIGYGFGSDPVFTGTPPSFPTIYCDSQGSQFNIHNVYSIGGVTSLYLACSNYDIDNFWGSYSYGDGAHYFGLVTFTGGGGEFHDSHIDMAWPVCQPAHGTSIAAWQSTHAYSTASCTTVQVTCNSVAFWIQLKTSGTSGGSAPTCAPFGVNITDGSAVWLLVNRATSYCVQIDTAAIEVQMREVDMTCAAAYNLGTTNTYASTPPSQLTFTDITPGSGVNGIVNLTAGNQITFNGSEFSNCITAGCAAMITTGSFSGNLIVSTSRFFNGLGYCLNHSIGTGLIFSNNWCNGTDTIGINTSANLSNIVANGNMIFPSAGNAWTLGNGITHSLVQNNVCNGAAISNGTPGASVSLQSPCL